MNDQGLNWAGAVQDREKPKLFCHHAKLGGVTRSLCELCKDPVSLLPVRVGLPFDERLKRKLSPLVTTRKKYHKSELWEQSGKLSSQFDVRK